MISGNRGLAELLSDRLDTARRAFSDQLLVASAERLHVFVIEGLVGLAVINAATGSARRAATLLAAVDRHNAVPLDAAERDVMERIEQRFLAPARVRLGAAAWKQAAAAGSHLTQDEAIALALGG